ncbi:DUF2259 domain-containing protein [Pararhizobium sp. IMCC21322]|uniref:DUF2259 domain-containing protein n=1 Tax=Pararhizobium sp. IMCC21322 TaxID=3067903 RepID=UPI002741A58A|nr:DUF2259 domain-containing protein [Pararhizobium sp. IMCC21322]
MMSSTRLFKHLIAVFAGLMVSEASAADLAELGSTGFSDDGAYFAFEQYGIQDGSGFAYASITIVDVKTDSWVSGTPIDVVLQEDSSSPNQARASAQQKASALLSQYGVKSSNGVLVAHNPSSEVSADPKNVRFIPVKSTMASGTPFEVQLDTFELSAGDNCAVFGTTYGFRLLLAVPGSVKILHEDTRIPTSRGCPLDYRIDQVYAHRLPGGRIALAIMLVMNTPGFEGPDGNYLAFTTETVW